MQAETRSVHAAGRARLVPVAIASALVGGVLGGYLLSGFTSAGSHRVNAATPATRPDVSFPSAPADNPFLVYVPGMGWVDPEAYAEDYSRVGR